MVSLGNRPLARCQRVVESLQEWRDSLGKRGGKARVSCGDKADFSSSSFFSSFFFWHLPVWQCSADSCRLKADVCITKKKLKWRSNYHPVFKAKGETKMHSKCQVGNAPIEI